MSALLREFGIDDSKLTEEEIAYYEQIATFAKANTKTKTQVQIGNDLTKAISWSAKQLTKEEAKTNIKYSRSVQ